MIASVVISNLMYLIGAIVLAAIGGTVVVVYHRKPKSVEANITSFNRGLKALAPEQQAPKKKTAKPKGRGARRESEDDTSTGETATVATRAIDSTPVIGGAPTENAANTPSAAGTPTAAAPPAATTPAPATAETAKTEVVSDDGPADVESGPDAESGTGSKLKRRDRSSPGRPRGRHARKAQRSVAPSDDRPSETADADVTADDESRSERREAEAG